jgi:hypothetical protein
MAKEKEEVKTGELIPHTYKALAMAPKQLTALLRDNLGMQQLNPFELDRVKVPAGGGLAWEVPTLDGAKSVQELEGIILHFRDPRAYWHEKFEGGNQPPDCKSDNGIVGVGSPGGDCLQCPLAKFGSALDDKGQPSDGQACQQKRVMLFLRQDSLLPMLVALPATSMKAAKQYFLRLTENGLHFRDVVTKIGLQKTKNKKGIAYSIATLARARDLNQEERERVLAISLAMKDMFERAAATEADVNREE